MKARFRDAATMLNYGFGIRSLYVDDNQKSFSYGACGIFNRERGSLCVRRGVQVSGYRR